MIIVLFGPDGSGKTTQIRLLTSYFKARGVKFYKTYISTHHLFAWILFKIFVTAGHYIWRPNVYAQVEKYPSPEVFSSRLGKIIKYIVEGISLLLAILLKVQLPSKLLKRLVIVERYIPSSLADFVCAFGISSLNSILVRILLALANDPKTVYVYLDADYETLIKRRGIRIEPEDYIKTQRMIYKQFAKNYNCLIIDTSKLDILTTQKVIREYIMEQYSKKLKVIV